MKKILMLASAISILFTGCNKNEIDSSINVDSDLPEYISASTPHTKVHLDDLTPLWHTSDRISLFAKSDAMHFYAFQSMNEDGASATFKYDSKQTDATIPLDLNYCIYPERGVSNGVSDNTVNADGIATTRIVFNQGYNAANLLDHAPMVAVSDNYEFEFVNVASVIRFNVKKSDDFEGELILEKITLNSASKYLSGTVAVDTKADEWVAVCQGSVHNGTVNLTPINAKITSEAQPFCLAIFPGTYPANDLTISFYYNNSGIKTLTYPAELVLGAGKIQDINCTLKPVVVEEEEDGTTVTTGGIFTYNNIPHLSCYTASVEGTVSGEEITEIGVLYQRLTSSGTAASQGEKLTYEFVGQMGNSTSTNNTTNQISKAVAESSETGSKLVKLTNLAGGDSESTYIYRYYAKTAEEVVYGNINQFKTEKYGQFVKVPAGTFMMGTADAAEGYDANYKTSPVHQVTITNEFEIGKYEVSSKEFAEFLEAIKSESEIIDSPLSVKYEKMNVYRTGNSANSNGVKYDNGAFKEVDKKKPVTGVTYIGAVKYCEWRTKNDANYSYRLPTEAEWEWASKGADKTQGYTYSGSNTVSEVAHRKTTNSTTVGRSGERYPNELGIYDMSGNAWEFVSDRSDYNWVDVNSNSMSYYSYCGESVTDPTGPVASDGYSFTGDKFYAVVRGGSSNDGGTQHCSSYRRTNFDGKQSYHSHSGFRVVRVRK